MEASILLIYVLISFKIGPPLKNSRGGIGPPLKKSRGGIGPPLTQPRGGPWPPLEMKGVYHPARNPLALAEIQNFFVNLVR